MKRLFWGLAIIALTLGIAILSRPVWPALFSYQDKIDPEKISGDYDPGAEIAIFNNERYRVPKFEAKVLGETTISLPDGVLRWIEVDLSKQRLYAYENGEIIYDFLISSGTWDRTPRGTFYVWTKIRSQKMSGGSKELGTYYYLPNVPYILFFYNENVPKQNGFSLHGTYWHNNFGTPMSHGCINMKTSEVAQIFEWAKVGTRITIYGKFKPANQNISSNISQ